MSIQINITEQCIHIGLFVYQYFTTGKLDFCFMLTIIFARREKVRNIVESEAGVTTEIMTFARIELLVV